MRYQHMTLISTIPTLYFWRLNHGRDLAYDHRRVWLSTRFFTGLHYFRICISKWTFSCFMSRLPTLKTEPWYTYATREIYHLTYFASLQLQQGSISLKMAPFHAIEITFTFLCLLAEDDNLRDDTFLNFR